MNVALWELSSGDKILKTPAIRTAVLSSVEVGFLQRAILHEVRWLIEKRISELISPVGRQTGAAGRIIEAALAAATAAELSSDPLFYS